MISMGMEVNYSPKFDKFRSVFGDDPLLIM